MRLYLVRHGEAVTKAVDPGRPLSERGRKDVQHMAADLAQKGVSVRRVLHSGKTRAAETAEILARQLAPGVVIEVSEGLNPNDPVAPFIEEILRMSEDTLVAGHLPFMASCVTQLVSGKLTPLVVNYLPGSVVCLEQHETEGWVINWMLRPDTR